MAEESASENRTRVLSEPESLDEQLTAEALLRRIPVKPQERYHFIRSIGFGGMKAVLLVHDADTGRDVAMAIMPDFRERPLRDRVQFIREALRTARLEHPNIVPVHDIGLDQNGSPYFTMKFLRGQSLAAVFQKLRRRDPATMAQHSPKSLLQIYIRICNAIAFAHSQGVLHLDLKPGNVHVGQHGEVSVIDWGLAREQGESSTLSGECGPKSGTARGTPGYMAPEQAAGLDELQSERTDIYALGAILYAFLTYQDPLQGLPVDERMRRTLSGDIPAPSEVAENNVPAALEAICRQAMALNPADRYGSVVELRADIFAFLTGYAPKAEKAPFWKQFLLFCFRNFSLLLLLALLLLIAIGVLLYLDEKLLFSFQQ